MFVLPTTEKIIIKTIINGTETTHEISKKTYDVFLEKKQNDTLEQCMLDYIMSKNKIELPEEKTFDKTSVSRQSGRKAILKLVEDNGHNNYECRTYAKLGSSKYYANPNKSCLAQDWLIVLNDIQNSVLNVFLIPKNTFTYDMFAHRQDDPEKLDVHFDKSFIDTTGKSSRVDLSLYRVDTIKYDDLNLEFQDTTTTGERRTRTTTQINSIDNLLEKWITKKTSPYNVMKAFFILLSKYGAKNITFKDLKAYTFVTLRETNFQPIFSQMKNGNNNVSKYKIFNIVHRGYFDMVELNPEFQAEIMKYKDEFLK